LHSFYPNIRPHVRNQNRCETTCAAVQIHRRHAIGEKLNTADDHPIEMMTRQVLARLPDHTLQKCATLVDAEVLRLLF